MEDGSSTCTDDELDNIILNGSSGPCSLPLEYLRRITDNFSDERLLGEGGFGKVYKGVLQNGKMVAVKRIDQLLKPGVQERQFENEVYHLMRLKHPNIVQFLGYCYETRNKCIQHDGKYIFAEMQQKLICLEYLPNRSLDRHISDEFSGYDWHTRYKIIKGICCGLLYLHEECQHQFGASIIHLDLKPGNILLDEYMAPKIADFGLSRLFEDNKTQTCATFVSGSLGYMAPEYLIGRIVTAKADIYNLGVIITEIITGSKVNTFSFSSPTSSRQKFVDGVTSNWRNRLEGAPSETDCKQIKHCLEIGLGCTNFKQEERPTSRGIVEKLERWETTNCNVSSEKSSAPDQILTHMEEKPSDSTTGYHSMFRALQLQDNVTGARNYTVDAGPRVDGSQNRSRPRGFFHRQLSRVMRFLSFIKPAGLSLEYLGDEDYEYFSDDEVFNSYALPVRVSTSATGAGRRRMSATAAGGSRMWATAAGGSDDDDSHPLPERGPTTKEFTFAEMEAATKGFSPEAKIGEGSFGTVYRGYLPDGREVAIKRRKSGQDDGHWPELSEFKLGVAFLFRCLCHKNLVGLVGYCAENDERLIVCEYMKNGALYDHLHPKAEGEPSESSSSSPSLVMSSWKLRIRILLDASRGIKYVYLHSRLNHGDIKSSNILLDASWRARVSDFGLSRLMKEKAGTDGYIDPEYDSLHYYLAFKRDVYSFGVVMLEVLTGKPAILEEPAAEGAVSPLSVVDYAVPRIISGELGKVLDPRVPEPAADEAEALGLVAYTALHCVQLKGKDRPGMEGVVASLQTAFELCEGNSSDGDLVESPYSDSLPDITPIDQD